MLDDRLDRLLYDVIEETIPDIEELSYSSSYQHTSEWIMRSHTRGVISGIEICNRILEIVDDSMEVKVINGDGMTVEEGDIIAIFSGRTSMITQLSVLIRTISERLSSIATHVSKYQSFVSDTEITLYSHYGFTPLFQVFEEYAFQQSGGLMLTSIYPHITLIDFQSFHLRKISKDELHAENDSVDHHRLIGVKVYTKDDYFAAISTNCDMIVICDFSVGQLESILNTDSTDYIRLISGKYSSEELLKISALNPSGLLMESFQNLPPFHIQIEQTR